MILVLSILMVPMASIAGNDRITISQNGYYMQKLSNPTAGEGEADGLVTPGDRFNSYAWATGELGDYIYVGSNRNLVGSTIELYIHAYGDKIPMDTVRSVRRYVYQWRIGPDAEGRAGKGGVIVRYNKTTGKMETVFESKCGHACSIQRYYRLPYVRGIQGEPLFWHNRHSEHNAAAYWAGFSAG